jgi:multiple sugar transport system permease protein
MKIKKIFFNTFAILIGILWLTPVFWMISTSLKTEKELSSLILIPKEPHWENYTILLGKAKILTWFYNSIFVSVLSTLGIVIISILAAYSVSRMDFPGRKFLFFLTLSGFMIPFQTIMIPLFLVVRDLKISNSLWAMILPRFASSLSVFILSQFFKGIPIEYDEAARIDGANEKDILFRVIVPMSWPAIVAIGILNFTYSWNDFVWPLIIATREEMYTLPIGLYALAGSDVNIRYGPIMAACTLTVIPIIVVYLLLQKYLISGVTLSAGLVH